MSVGWLSPEHLAARRIAAEGPLRPLAASLAADLDAVLGRPIEIPTEKARLSRTGGRCPHDGTQLAFDPWSPRLHRCPACGAAYDDEAHYRWWIMGFHLWLAERAVHAATLHALSGEERYARFAADVLERYAEAYLRWPNVDNVLGPTRPFFSTYLESVWLLQLCVVLELLETCAAPVRGAAIRERLVEPSMRLVLSYDEGDSNRQVWNDAALLAAARLLGDRAVAERAVHGRSGVVAHLSRALLADGTWYEGENYHLFAHRGLWYGVHLAEAAGQGPVPAPLLARFDAGFAAPFLTALPDLTFPARRDSQYAVSLRQWRVAELAELGLARAPHDRRLQGALARLYDGGAPERDTGRWRSTAEAERNEPAARLTRADLGWRSLLFALPELPPLRTHAPASVLLDAQGFAVLRREAGRVYAALDYGVSGGGHGHPDRLDVLLSVGNERWLDDPGTGSYVDPSLHWYRSTLAHHAPLVNGRSQPAADGVLHAFEDRGGAGWVDAEVVLPPGVTLRRTIVAMPDYLLDELRWQAAEGVRVLLPYHGIARVDGPGGWTPADAPFEGASFLRDVACTAAAFDGVARLTRADAGAPCAWVAAAGAAWWRATAPGAPGRAPAPVHAVELHGHEGVLRTVWSWCGAVTDVAPDGDALHVHLHDGSRHAHARTAEGWRIDLHVGRSHSSIDLAGLRPGVEHAATSDAAAPNTLAPLPTAAAPLRAALGEAHYRRSELSWHEAGRPAATVELFVRDALLHVHVEVRKPALAFVPPGAVNDMDNERADVNGDGVQVHLAARRACGANGAPDATRGWLLVPETGARVRVVPLDSTAPPAEVHADWRRTAGGYVLDARLPLAPLRADVGPGGALGVGLLVNEGAPGRVRRQGQLALGGGGDFVYLQGDRHPPARYLWFADPDV